MGGKKMDIMEYFEKAQGWGVLSTADTKGKVDTAIYSRPHIMGDGTIAFIMPDRLTHHNLQSNPHAAYLFIEDGKREEGKRFVGKRLYLTKVKEEKDTELLYSIRRKTYGDEREGRYLVFFQVDKVLPLVGAGEEES